MKDGNNAFSLNLLSNTVTYLKPHDPAFTPVPIQPGQRPEGNCFSADERTLYVTNRASETVCAIDIATLKVRASAKTGVDPTRIYRDTRDRLFVTNYGEDSMFVYDSELNRIGQVELPALPIAMSFHPERPLAYVSLKDDRVGLLDLDTLQFERYIKTLREPDVSKVVIR